VMSLVVMVMVIMMINILETIMQRLYGRRCLRWAITSALYHWVKLTAWLKCSLFSITHMLLNLLTDGKLLLLCCQCHSNRIGIVRREHRSICLPSETGIHRCHRKLAPLSSNFQWFAFVKKSRVYEWVYYRFLRQFVKTVRWELAK
jgi:hypothetical protein